MSERRFRDPGTTVYELADRVLVVCPRCEHQATISRRTSEDSSPDDTWARIMAPKRLTCASCLLGRDWPGNQAVAFGGPTDPYFHLPLWLRQPCCGQVLWAYNERHLALLRSFVAATVRERAAFTDAPSSMLEKLPRWMTLAKHRREILAAITALQERLAA
jgi:hypothetical protein